MVQFLADLLQNELLSGLAMPSLWDIGQVRQCNVLCLWCWLITCLVNALAKFLWSKFEAPEGALSFVPTYMVYIHGLHTWSTYMVFLCWGGTDSWMGRLTWSLLEKKMIICVLPLIHIKSKEKGLSSLETLHILRTEKDWKILLLCRLNSNSLVIKMRTWQKSIFTESLKIHQARDILSPLIV